MAGGYPGTAWLRSTSGRSAGKVRPSSQRLVSPMGEGSTAASQGFAAGMCCISVRAAAGAHGVPSRFHTVFTHEWHLPLLPADGASGSAWKLSNRARNAHSFENALLDGWLVHSIPTETPIKEWADKEKVDVQIDFITSQGNKLLLTTAAEAQARSGHDILAMNTFLPARYSEVLVPMNDVVEPLIKENGAVNATVEYLGKVDGKWLAVPATVG